MGDVLHHAQRGRPRDLRRFFSLEVLQQIAAYFYTSDLSGFDPRVLPGSAELAEKKLRSLQLVRYGEVRPPLDNE